MKELETVEATQRRLYKQVEDNLIKDKIRVEESLDREQIVFEKNKEYQLKQQEEMKNKIKDLGISNNKKLEELKNKNTKLEKLIQKDEERLKQLRQIYQEEQAQIHA